MEINTSSENWYKTALLIEQMNKEAAIKDYFPAWLSAAMISVLLSGLNVDAASKKLNLDQHKKQQLTQTLQNKDLVKMFESYLHSKPSTNLENQQQQLIPQKKYFESPFKMPTPNKINIPTENKNTEKNAIPPNKTVTPPLNTAIPLSEVIHFIANKEGKPFLYKHRDPTKKAKNWIIGYGFNLTTRPDAKQMLKNIGVNYKSIMNGKSGITQSQAIQLLQNDVNRIIKTLPTVINDFNKLPSDAKFVLIDMAYNMGLPRLNKFDQFLNALKNKDYTSAVKEMINSDWYNQVGDRAQALVQKLTNLSEKVKSNKN